MGYTPYFVGPIRTGLKLDLDPYLLPEDAFTELDNAYTWRGRVYRKGGTQFCGRLGVRTDDIVNNTAGFPNRLGAPQVYAGTLVNFPIEPGTLIITDGITTFTDNGSGVMAVTAGFGTPGTINYTTGVFAAVTFTALNNGAAVTGKYIVVVNNNSPVMGLRTFDIASNILDSLIAFDLTQAYLFDGGFPYPFNGGTTGFSNISTYKKPTGQTTGPLPVAWTGTNTDFFQSTNFAGAFWATNNVPGAHAYAISAIVTGVTTQVTVGVNNFVIGDIVGFSNVIGVTKANPTPPPAIISLINGLTGVITNVAGPVITVAIDTSTATTPYVSGGIAYELTRSKAAAGDGIRWYDGTGWVNFMPPLTSGDPNIAPNGNPRLLKGALMILPYKGYLLALNTVEGTLGTQERFVNRIRWSQQVNSPISPYYVPPIPAGTSYITDPSAWVDNVPGFGGFLDAATGEQIVSAEFIKDSLIVYFEASTWRFTYTGNPVLPFVWEKLNTEIGSFATFSTIPFDRGILSIGQNGAYTCDGVNVSRIDRIIPDVVFSFQDTNKQNKRVHGIRDFFGEFAYWIYASDEEGSIFPNRMLVYNYVDEAFALFRLSYTALGHFNENQQLTWGNANLPWGSYNIPWGNSAQETGFPVVVAGNQEGFVDFLFDADGDDILPNVPNLSITAISAANPAVFTVPNHNLDAQDGILQNSFVKVFDPIVGSTGLDGQVLQVLTIIDSNNFTLQDDFGIPVTVAAYTGDAQLALVDNFYIKTKNLNPFFAQGRAMRLGYVDVYFKNNYFNEDAEFFPLITVNLYQDDDSLNIIETQTVGLYDQYDQDNDVFWNRIYFTSQGRFISLEFTYTSNLDDDLHDEPGQMFNAASILNNVEIHGLILWMKPAGRLLGTI